VVEAAVSVCGFTLDYADVDSYLNAIKYCVEEKGRETKRIFESFSKVAKKYNDKLFQILLYSQIKNITLRYISYIS